jgi:hypothetical protein
VDSNLRDYNSRAKYQPGQVLFATQVALVFGGTAKALKF